MLQVPVWRACGIPLNMDVYLSLSIDLSIHPSIHLSTYLSKERGGGPDRAYAWRVGESLRGSEQRQSLAPASPWPRQGLRFRLRFRLWGLGWGVGFGHAVHSKVRGAYSVDPSCGSGRAHLTRTRTRTRAPPALV